MGEGARFDDLARGLATGTVSRRTALQRLAGVAFGIGLAATPSALADEVAYARCPKPRRCKGKCCPRGARCKRGRCKCKGGKKKCAGKCVDVQVSTQHCGRCGRACAGNEVCEDGSCVPAGCEPVSDGLACTTDTCDPKTGETTHVLIAGSCLVGGQCYTHGEACPGGFCDAVGNPTICTPENLCGNGVLDMNEECDGGNLDGETCQSLGFDGGTLACGSNCMFDTSGCITNGCESAADCPGEDTECRSRACTQGTCGFIFTASGTPVGSQTAGDCQQDVCDGLGNVASINDNSDVPTSPFACATGTCQDGVPTYVPNNSACDDGLACTQDFCDPSLGCQSIPAPAGTACTDGGGTQCDGSGNCIAACNTPGDCPPKPSQCQVVSGCTNGMCDYQPDPGLGTPCSVGTGACANQGLLICDGQGQLVCSASPNQPSQETCDGVDNDCDGVIDEGNPGGGAPCSTGSGAGTFQCIGGSLTCVSDTRRHRLIAKGRWRRT